MLLYRVLRSFLVTSLDKYIFKDALIYRYENSTKLSIRMSPGTDTNLSITTTDFEYDLPELVTWFYAIEPAPGGDSTQGILEFIEQLPEDVAGGGIPGAGGIIIGDMVYGGEITDPADFPDLVDRTIGQTFKVKENVTDPETGEDYCEGDFIMWDGTTYCVIGSPNIGEAEDGDYSDGLFDFNECTKIGTAIDNINEALKDLSTAPPPSDSKITSSSATVNNGQQIVLDEVSITEFRTCKWLISTNDNTNITFMSLELLAQHDDVDSTNSQYAFQGEASVSFDTDVSGGMMRLLVTASADNQVVKAERLCVPV